MKPRLQTFSLVSLLVFAAAWLAGCASEPARSAGPPAILVAIQMADGTVPTPALAARIQRAVAPDLERTGMVQAHNRAQADYVLTVVFTPDPVNPDGGHLDVGRVVPIRRITETNNGSHNPSLEMMAKMKSDQAYEMSRQGSSEASH